MVVGNKMDIRKKENYGLNISFKLDYKNYSEFKKEIITIGKKHEDNSTPQKIKYSILANCMKLPYMDVKGWCSRCVDKDGRITEVFFCDYDNVLFRVVEDEARYLTNKYKETPIYIFSTDETKDCNGEEYGNYYMVSIKKHTFKEVIEMQEQLHCDQAYKKIPLIYRFKTYVLRLGEKGDKDKPKFKCVIGDVSKKYNQDVSEPHLKILKAIYPSIPKIKYTNLDGRGIDKLFVTEYKTASK